MLKYAFLVICLSFPLHAASEAEDCDDKNKSLFDKNIINSLFGSKKCKEKGEASWYGPGFHGKKTACGQVYNQNKMTAAHKTLPCGTKVTVINKANGRRVTVVINDRGPYAHGRIIDLSKAAANRLGISGVGNVCLSY